MRLCIEAELSKWPVHFSLLENSPCVFRFADVRFADMSLEGRVLVRGCVGLGLGGLILEEGNKTAERAYSDQDSKFPLFVCLSVFVRRTDGWTYR